MLITEEEAKRRLDSPNNLSKLSTSLSPRDSYHFYQSSAPQQSSFTANKVTHYTPPSKGQNKTGKKVIPEFIRDVIADITTTPGAPADLTVAAAFGVSGTVVSDARNGRVGGLPPSEVRQAKLAERKERIEGKVDKIVDSALDKLMVSLGLVDEVNLADLKPGELGRFAVDMAKIKKTLTSDDKQGSSNPVNIVVYAPESRPESRYKVVEV